MKNGTAGFTLIELLIVIVIIGILAVVLIPQLMNARTSATKRAIQAHSGNVYKATMATLADDQTLTPATAITAVGGADCKAAHAAGAGFGWNAAPRETDTCVLAENGSDDFTVTVTGDASTGLYASVNGR